MLLVAIFLAVPLIVYDQFRAADRATADLLLQSVREQGRVMAQALQPMVANSDKPSIPDLGRELQRFASDTTRVKVIYQPTGRTEFYYVASWPPVAPSNLSAERETPR